jgi:hypothetical protein
MLLPSFILRSRQNQLFTESGIDTLKECIDKTYFKNYLHQIEYQHNSRGYRDAEWPDTITELQNAIWCFGDSFTVGLGSPLTHTWVNILQSKSNQRCINVSMDGASNNWMARKILTLLEEINPKLIIIHWSFTHRNEESNTALSDEDRRIWTDNNFLAESGLLSEFNSFINFINLIKQVEQKKQKTKIIHSFIPKFFESSFINHPIQVESNDHSIQTQWNNIRGPEWPETPNNQLSTVIQQELKDFGMYDLIKQYCELSGRLRPYYEFLNTVEYVPELINLDFARDSLHYDIITATNFVDRLVNLIDDSRQT